MRLKSLHLSHAALVPEWQQVHNHHRLAIDSRLGQEYELLPGGWQQLMYHVYNVPVAAELSELRVQLGRLAQLSIHSEAPGTG